MSRRRLLIPLAICLAFAVTVALTACDGDGYETVGGGGGTATATPTAGGDSDAGSGAEGGSGESDAAGGSEAAETTVRLYWVSAGENALGIERSVTDDGMPATAAMEALLAGPAEAEKETWPAISTAIPEGSELLGLSITDGVATVDLSEEFESGGGTFSVTARLAQVVYTLTQFDTVDAVRFRIEGESVGVFSSEGLVLDGPQTFEDYEQLLPVDA